PQPPTRCAGRGTSRSARGSSPVSPRAPWSTSRSGWPSAWRRATSCACSPTAGGSISPRRRGRRTSRSRRSRSRRRCGGRGSERMSDPRPIGVFDSGLGGLTVVRAIMDDLPAEPIAYVGDTARFPYGPRPAEEIRRFAVPIARHLLTLDVKLIVVACNSATSAALDQVTAAVPVPVVGVIEPAVRAAVRATRNRRVGLIGTEVTVSSGAYQRSFAESAPDVEVTAQPCPRFVEFVERGDTTSVELL